MHKLLLPTIIAVFSLSLNAQITVVSNASYNNPLWMAQNVLVAPGFPTLAPMNLVNFNNIPQPSTTQIAYFYGNSSLGIDSGIVMSTAAATLAAPNGFGAAPQNVTPSANLSALQAQMGLNNVAINDKVQIAFSFVAVADSIEFEYVFASEEYQNYTCSNFNDLFGFFLMGQEINGNPLLDTVNLAVIPNTSPPVPVAINTVNQGFPSGSNSAAPCLNANPNYSIHNVYYTNSLTGVNSNITGHTVPLKAKAQVKCGNLYTIRMLLSNAADHAYQSYVFLKQNSFESPKIVLTPSYNQGTNMSDSIIVEGCSSTFLVFSKDGNVNNDLNIKFNVSGTAIMGVDYAPIPDSIFLPAGVVKDSIEIIPFDDGIAEPAESVIIEMQATFSDCFVYPPQSHTFWIRDRNLVDVEISTPNSTSGFDTISCPGDQIELMGVVTGGEGVPVGYWMDDSLAPATRVVSPMATTTYFYIGNDECADTPTVESFTIVLADYVPLVTSGFDTLICVGELVEMQAIVEGGRPPYQITWQNGVSGPWHSAYPSDTTIFYYQVVDGCGVVARDSFVVNVAPDPVPFFTWENDGAVPLQINFLDRSQNHDSVYWDFGNGFWSNELNPATVYMEPGNYEVTLYIFNQYGCSAAFSAMVEAKSDLLIYVPNSFSPNGDGINDEFLIKGVGFESWTLQVFDRWGQKVYEGTDTDPPFDGNYNGTPLMIGVYTFYLHIDLGNLRYRDRTGTLNIIR